MHTTKAEWKGMLPAALWLGGTRPILPLVGRQRKPRLLQGGRRAIFRRVTAVS